VSLAAAIGSEMAYRRPVATMVLHRARVAPLSRKPKIGAANARLTNGEMGKCRPAVLAGPIFSVSKWPFRIGSINGGRHNGITARRVP
jgi:hypothetical protein